MPEIRQSEIQEITAQEEKSEICGRILRALPDWFGIPESIDEYVAGVADKPFYAVFSSADESAEAKVDAVGFVSIKIHNAHTAEIYVMGILAEYHGRGLGRKIVAVCEDFCRTRGMEFLTVKTLSETHPDIFYKKTRLFYEAMGFKPLEVFPLLWDECNPCLFLTKYIGS